MICRAAWQRRVGIVPRSEQQAWPEYKVVFLILKDCQTPYQDNGVGWGIRPLQTPGGALSPNSALLSEDQEVLFL